MECEIPAFLHSTTVCDETGRRASARVSQFLFSWTGSQDLQDEQDWVLAALLRPARLCVGNGVSPRVLPAMFARIPRGFRPASYSHIVGKLEIPRDSRETFRLAPASRYSSVRWAWSGSFRSSDVGHYPDSPAEREFFNAGGGHVSRYPAAANECGGSQDRQAATRKSGEVDHSDLKKVTKRHNGRVQPNVSPAR